MKNLKSLLTPSVMAMLISTVLAGLIALETGLRNRDSGWTLLLAFLIQSLTALKAALSPSPTALGGLSVDLLLREVSKRPELLQTLLAVTEKAQEAHHEQAA